jgi:hypothetical protein
MAPQFGMRLVPFAEDLAGRHCRAPPGFLFHRLATAIPVVPKS